MRGPMWCWGSCWCSRSDMMRHANCMQMAPATQVGGGIGGGMLASPGVGSLLLLHYCDVRQWGRGGCHRGRCFATGLGLHAEDTSTAKHLCWVTQCLCPCNVMAWMTGSGSRATSRASSGSSMRLVFVMIAHSFYVVEMAFWIAKTERHLSLCSKIPMHLCGKASCRMTCFFMGASS